MCSADLGAGPANHWMGWVWRGGKMGMMGEKAEKVVGKDEVEKMPCPEVREATGEQAVPEGHVKYPIDEVEEASLDSFPASDPPAFGTGHV